MDKRVTRFEIPCNHPEKTMEFFKSAFNWSFKKLGDQDYWFAHTGDESTPGINGAIMKKRHPNQPITNSISVNDIDSSMEAVKNSGGTIVVPKMPIPDTGWLSFFKDPDGNIHGLWQEDFNAK